MARLTQRIATRFEGLIRRAPEQWHVFQPLWLADRARSGGVTKFENRPLAGDAEFEALGPSVVLSQPDPVPPVPVTSGPRSVDGDGSEAVAGSPGSIPSASTSSTWWR